jgi:hypothetical protein
MPGEDKTAIVAQARAKVLSFLAADRERVISKRVARRLQEAARYFHSKAIDAAGLAKDWTSLHTSVDPVALHTEESGRIDAILKGGDYDAAIRVYPNKGLWQQVTGLFGSTNLQRYLRKLVSASEGDSLRASLRKRLPVIT